RGPVGDNPAFLGCAVAQRTYGWRRALWERACPRMGRRAAPAGDSILAERKLGQAEGRHTNRLQATGTLQLRQVDDRRGLEYLGTGATHQVGSGQQGAASGDQ